MKKGLMKIGMMKIWLILLICLISCQAQAEIFVCKDVKNNLTYQDEPCLSQTIRKLKNIPDAPIEEQILARERLSKTIALSQQRAATAEIERQQQAKEFRERQTLAIEARKLELLEREANTPQQVFAPQWILGMPGYPFRLNRPYIHSGRSKSGNNRSGINRFGTNRSGGNRQQNNQDRNR